MIMDEESVVAEACGREPTLDRVATPTHQGAESSCRPSDAETQWQIQSANRAPADGGTDRC